MTTDASVPRVVPLPPSPVAPRWHTLLLVAILFLFALGGARLQSRSSAPGVIAQHQGLVLVYLSTLRMGAGGLRLAGDTAANPLARPG
jgi:hypothetical protein